MACKQWIELDDENGHLFEYCRGSRMVTTCAAQRSECRHPTHYQEPQPPAETRLSESEAFAQAVCWKEVNDKTFAAMRSIKSVLDVFMGKRR